MAWRLANSLVTLRNEINLVAPNRSKVSDGTLGDAAHQSRCSRHNPNDFGVVCAFDCTHDPNGGMDVHRLARLLTVSPRHPELEYIVSNRQIASRSGGWVWRAYSGSNPHTLHAHFAVGRGSDCEPTPPYDSTQSWNVRNLYAPAVSEPFPVNLVGGTNMLMRYTVRLSDGRTCWAVFTGLAGQKGGAPFVRWVTNDAAFQPVYDGAQELSLGQIKNCVLIGAMPSGDQVKGTWSASDFDSHVQ